MVRDTADLDEPSRDQFPKGSRGIARFHEVLADENCIETGLHEAAEIRCARYAAFAHLDYRGRDVGREVERVVERDFERAEVAVVYADDLGAGAKSNGGKAATRWQGELRKNFG
jgi:hypothetical protein